MVEQDIPAGRATVIVNLTQGEPLGRVSERVVYIGLAYGPVWCVCVCVCVLIILIDVGRYSPDVGIALSSILLACLLF